MSDAMAEIRGAAPKGANGRMVSRARRQALSHSGKSGLAQVGKAAPAPAPATAPASDVAHAAAPEPSRDLGRSMENGNETRACGCEHAAAQPSLEAVLDEVCELAEAVPHAVGMGASGVRQLCQERRRALSSQGKTAVKSAAMSASKRPGIFKGVAAAGLSGRAAARARREEMCVNGRGSDPACRPSGRVRTQANPAKVEVGTTLSGNTVSGTQVERTHKVTGVETGSCRAITGTEYIGSEQYTGFCSSTPDAAAPKVSFGTTSRGQLVSGTEVGRSQKVTGDEHGECRSVTGTEYLGVEQFESLCAAKPEPAPAKVGVAETRAGQSVSGSQIGRSNRVTGDEPGACLKLTGSQYVQEQPGSACRTGSGKPHKVSVMSTLKDRPVTGTDVAPGSMVTGGERGACADVTGTESSGLEQYQGCNRKPVPAPEKVGVMRTWHDQQVSGTAMERSSRVTGDEYGGCQPISGTEYIGPEQYTTFCDTDRQAASRALMASRGARAGVAPSGNRVESGHKVTGAERGENQMLSGTPYSGPFQRMSQRDANSNMHPINRGPASAVREQEYAPREPEMAGSFSIVTPARGARDKIMNRITGTAYGAVGRITGPINMAAGLVSGTPEFRYQEDMPAGVAVQVSAAAAVRSRLTGDGREGGIAITGAAWRRNEYVTGTESTSMLRNPTLRSERRGAPATAIGASQLKDRERAEVAVSKITGSSGNDAKGSYITYSGGARG